MTKRRSLLLRETWSRHGRGESERSTQEGSDEEMICGIARQLGVRASPEECEQPRLKPRGDLERRPETGFAILRDPQTMECADSLEWSSLANSRNARSRMFWSESYSIVHGDNNFPAGMSFSKIPESFSRFT